MSQIPIEQYLEKLRNGDPKYQWPLKYIDETKTIREAIHEKFPYVITYSGLGSHSGCLLDNMQDWCREQFGDKYGDCHWSDCEWSHDRWYKESGLEDELDAELDSKGPRPSKKDKKALKKWEELGDEIIDKHFEMLETRLDAPGKHCHWGVWTAHYVCKIGYDEGYEDYCFKNPEDAVYFKIMWAEEATRRG